MLMFTCRSLQRAITMNGTGARGWGRSLVPPIAQSMKTPLIDAIRAKDEDTVIQLLNSEDAHATEKDQFSRSPLFYGILLKYNYEEVLEKLIQLNPDIVKEADRWGDYLLFTAVRKNSMNLKLIKKLIEVFPDRSICSQAFHIALSMGEKVPREVIELLFESSDTKLACSQFLFNRSPLAYVLKYLIPHVPMSILVALLRNSPINYLVDNDVEHVSPLKRSLSQTNRWESDEQQSKFIDVLLGIAKNRINFDEEDHHGRTVLHYALLHRAKHKTVELIIKQNPKMLLHRDSNGRLPLHLAIQRKCSDDTIMALIRAYPGATKEVGGLAQYLPLEFAARHDSPTRVRNAIIRENAKDAKVFVSLVAQQKKSYKTEANVKKAQDYGYHRTIRFDNGERGHVTSQLTDTVLEHGLDSFRKYMKDVTAGKNYCRGGDFNSR